MPTNAQLKIERALELFNDSEHPRTVAGLARTLGSPHTGAATSSGSAAEVVLTVAWELSWYQFNVDLSDGRDPVRLRGQGHELSELPDESQDWNCQMAEDGTITLGSRSEEPEVGAAPTGESAGEGEERPLSGEGLPMIYCVIPEPLADQLYDKMTDYYKDEPNVEVIVDRRKAERRDRGSTGGGQRVIRDRRRRRPGMFPRTKLD